MPHAHPSGFPPRAFDPRENTPTNRFPDRGTARDRPSPYGAGVAFFSVARGPVPRERSTRAKTARRPTPFPVPIEARRGTGPRPTINGTLFIVARGTGPRDRHRPDAFFPSVVCDRLITNRSRSGDLDLQSLAREHWRGTGFPNALR